jgi:imidazole glycerol-phosphate synthase subunit HisH
MQPKISDFSEKIIVTKGDFLVLPGVGAFGEVMKKLKSNRNMELITDAVLSQNICYFGICLGMQIIFEKSFEFGETEGLGWLPGYVSPIKVVSNQIKLPHVGWNTISARENGFLSNEDQQNFYFVHSNCVTCDNDLVAARFDYGTSNIAAVQFENIFGVQFHPEKSSGAGLRVLKKVTEKGQGFA